MRIGHISDLHILHIDGPRPLQFLNKRLVGGLNLLLNRSKAHSRKVVERALHQLDDMDVDHIVISGDLTNLALASEFEAARDVVMTIPEALRRVSVVAGNHDYYTPDAVKDRRFETYFADFLKSDLPEYQLEHGYPFCHLRGPVAFVGLNSGIATPWLFATGRVRDDELQAAERLLQHEEVQSRFKVVVVHHPLFPDAHHKVGFNRRMINREEVLTALRRADVDLVMHGHNHVFSIVQVPKLGTPGTTYVCEAGSTSMDGGGDERIAGRFNIYTVEDGALLSVESHLFRGHESGFLPFYTEAFHHEIGAE